MIFQTLQLPSYTSCRHDLGHCDDKCDKQQAWAQGTGARDMYARALLTFFFLLLFIVILTAPMVITTTSKHLTTRGPWTTTTASLTCQNMATTSTCQNMSITATRTCNDDKWDKRGPGRRHVSGLYFLYVFFFFLIFQFTNGYFLDFVYSTSNEDTM